MSSKLTCLSMADLVLSARRECFCNFQFNVKQCSIQGIFRTSDVMLNDPDSLACPAGTVNVMSRPLSSLPKYHYRLTILPVEQMIKFPIPAEELSRFREQLPMTKPKRPYAFIFGHGLWNDLDLQATLDWLGLILDTSLSQAPC